MTWHSIQQAVQAMDENNSRLAWRTAYFQRVPHKHFPKTEEAIFRRAAPVRKRQTIDEQYKMMRLISKVMR